MQSFEHAWHHVAALTQCDPAICIIDARMIHDTDKGVAAIPLRGTLPDIWNNIVTWNNAGYGAFITMADMDGHGLHAENVRASRVQAIDLDNISAQQNYDRAAAWTPTPSFATNTSIVYRDDGQIAYHKYHVAWSVPYYKDNDLFALRQRKLRQLFDGDRTIIDAPRVLRLAGTLHLKNLARPHLVTFWSLGGGIVPHETIDAALSNINVIDTAGTRHPLGSPDLAAPSLDWIKHALTLLDPNELDRGAWMGITYAVKQSGWSLTDPDTLFGIWSEWCAKYENNDPAENRKQWESVRDTELGWQSLKNRIPSLKADVHLGGHSVAMPATDDAAVPPMPAPPALDCSGEILTDYEQREYFAGCIAIEQQGEILTPSGRFMSPTKFNLKYGGRQFIYTSTGKTTDEAWKAATRSTLWTVPKVDHTRFLPDLPFGEIVTDQLKRPGVNTYIPIVINSKPGDVTPFLRHMEFMLPVEADRTIIYQYLAHCVKFPGFKIAWAPMIQSTEGVGKGFLGEVMETIIGEMYCYRPKANELVKSGSTFNGWMRSKLFIIVDEIRVDEKRELVEILKPMIADKRIEIQSKGIDQEMQDNFCQFLFFSNYKDAIPINKNGRRYCIFYSAIQSLHDLQTRGMTDEYFTQLFAWLHNDGAAHIAHWLLNYPIERGAIPMRAPNTSSTPEAQRLSRSPIERVIAEAVEDALPGFRGGWLSSLSIAKRIKDTGTVRGSVVSLATIETIASGMGYFPLGRSPRAYFQEGAQERTYLFALAPGVDMGGFARAQGWE